MFKPGDKVVYVNNMFKPGDKVVCINNDLTYNSELILNQIYIINSIWEDYVGIKNKNGYSEYLESRFITLKEYRKLKLIKICSIKEIK